MPFALATDRRRSAIDPDTNSRLVIDGTPQIEFRTARFSAPEVSFDTTIELRRKFQDRIVVTNDPQNPCVMISSGALNRVFAGKHMFNFEFNTHLAERLVRMIAFINKRYPIANAPFLWSDFGTIRPGPARWFYRMPSDEELLRISLQPEQGTSG